MPTNSEIQAFSRTIQKEWRVVTATGTPTAVAGDILTQVLQNNSGSIVATWFNNTTSVLLTVAPTVVNLIQNTGNGQLLPANTNGRQSWHMRIAGAGLSSNSLVGGAGTYVDNVLTGSGDYTVPAGKVLRVTCFNGFGAHNSSFSAAGNGGYMAGNLCLLGQNGAAVTISSVQIHNVNWAASSTSTTNGSTMAQAIQHNGFMIPDGTIEIAAGFRVNIGCVTANINSGSTTLSSVQCGWSGYLYTA